LDFPVRSQAQRRISAKRRPPHEHGSELRDRIHSTSPAETIESREEVNSETVESIRLDGMGSLRRSHMCGDVTDAMVGSEVVLAGWVNRRRDHGGVIFVDLRDRSGIVQVVFKPEVAAEAHQRGGLLRSEFVVMVRGQVELRSDDTINPKMPTGRVEVNVTELRLLNSATSPRPRAGRSRITASQRSRRRCSRVRRPKARATSWFRRACSRVRSMRFPSRLSS